MGSDKSVAVDVRLITATHRNLEQMIADGTFREDLYYRLNVVSVTLPPLRDRREDLMDLVFFFLKKSVQKLGKPIRQIDPEALTALERHPWPGNIRELENAIERAVVLADGDTVFLRDLPDDIRRSIRVAAESSVGNILPQQNAARAAAISVSGTGSASERGQLLDALSRADGNKARAARLLNMPRSTFYSKLRKFGLNGNVPESI